MFKNRIFSGLYFARFSLNIENDSENFEYGHFSSSDMKEKQFSSSYKETTWLIKQNKPPWLLVS